MALASPRTSAPDASEPDYRIAGYGYQNWSLDGPPPILINTQARTHSKLAWCWGETRQLEDLAHTLCTHEDQALAHIGELLASRVMPLLSMLEHLSEVSCEEVRHD